MAQNLTQNNNTLNNSTFICYSDDDCSFLNGIGGWCVDSVCACWAGYSKPDCNTNFSQANYYYFQIFANFYALAFGLLTIYSGFQLYVIYKAYRRTPAMLRATFWFMFLGCFVRLLYQIIDPHNQRHIMPKIIEEILFGLGITLFVSSYITLLGSWIELYGSVEPDKKYSSFWVKNIKIIIAVIVVSYIVTDTSVGALRSTKTGTASPVAKLAIITIPNATVILYGGVCSIIFLIVGRRLIKKVKDFQRMSTKRKMLQRVNGLTVTMSSFALALICILITVYILRLSIPGHIMWYTYHVVDRFLEMSFCIIMLFWFRFNFKKDEQANTNDTFANENTKVSSKEEL